MSAISVVVTPFLCLLGYIVRRLVIEKLRVVSNIWNSLFKLFEILLLTIVIVSYLLVTMSFQVEDFTASPRLAILTSLKKTELVSLATHYKLEIPSGSRKADIRKIITKYLVEEEIVSEEEEDTPTDLELKRLEYQEREWEQCCCRKI